MWIIFLQGDHYFAIFWTADCSFFLVMFFFCNYLVICSVYTGDRYMEHRVHLCRAINREASFPGEKCGSSIGSDD